VGDSEVNLPYLEVLLYAWNIGMNREDASVAIGMSYVFPDTPMNTPLFTSMVPADVAEKLAWQILAVVGLSRERQNLLDAAARIDKAKMLIAVEEFLGEKRENGQEEANS